MPTPSPTEYCLFWIDHWSTCMQKGEWSGWVQAIGAIVAIIAAATFVRWQHVMEQARIRASDLELRKRRYAVVIELAQATCHHALALAEELSDRERVHSLATSDPYHYETLAGDLGSHVDAVPLHDLDDDEFVHNVMLIVAHTRQMKLVVGRLMARHSQMNAADFTDAFDLLRNLANECAKCHMALLVRAAVSSVPSR